LCEESDGQLVSERDLNAAFELADADRSATVDMTEFINVFAMV